MTNDELDTVARALVGDLHEPRPPVFWADAIGTAAVGWTAFAVGLMARVTYIRRRALPGFETAWNVLFGVPLLLPSFTYMGVHQSHHSLSTYGTKDDPEYLPFASSRRLMVIFAIQSTLLMPVALIVRFLLISPIGLVVPSLHR